MIKKNKHDLYKHQHVGSMIKWRTIISSGALLPYLRNIYSRNLHKRTFKCAGILRKFYLTNQHINAAINSVLVLISLSQAQRLACFWKILKVIGRCMYPSEKIALIAITSTAGETQQSFAVELIAKVCK